MQQIDVIQRTIEFGNRVELCQQAPPGKDPAFTWYRWTIFFRAADGKPLRFVERVTFKLHESMTNSRRTVSAEPFEVSEYGWGTFQIEVTVKISSMGNLKFVLPLRFPHQTVPGKTFEYKTMDMVYFEGLTASQAALYGDAKDFKPEIPVQELSDWTERLNEIENTLMDELDIYG
ncbi:hypothetical protein PCE1_003347 [Barthelona sp. PCE]